jgi:hypothetical protein
VWQVCGVAGGGVYGSGESVADVVRFVRVRPEAEAVSTPARLTWRETFAGPMPLLYPSLFAARIFGSLSPGRDCDKSPLAAQVPA